MLKNETKSTLQIACNSKVVIPENKKAYNIRGYFSPCQACFSSRLDVLCLTGYTDGFCIS